MKKFFFGVFTFTLGLACGLLLGKFIGDFMESRQIEPILQGAIIIVFVSVTFFLWRWTERKKKPNPKPTDHPKL